MRKLLFFSLVLLFQPVLALGKANDIYSFRVLEQTAESVTFEVSYHYSGDHGAEASLTAWPLPPGFWGSTIVPLVAGDHAAQLKVRLGPRVQKEVLSDSVEFFFYSGGGPPFYRKTFPFKKKWTNSSEQRGAGKSETK